MAKNEHCACAHGHLKQAMEAADADDHETAMKHVGRGMLALKRARPKMDVEVEIGGVPMSRKETGMGVAGLRKRLRDRKSS